MIGLLKKYFFRIIFQPREVLLKNTGLKQTILKNTFWLAVSEGTSNLLKFFLFIYTARILGAYEYGKFSFGLAFVGIFSFIADFGIAKIMSREFAGNKEKEKDFPAMMSLQVILSLISIIFIFTFSFFITQDYAVRKIILVLGLFVLIEIFLDGFFAFFQARERMEYQAWVAILKMVLITGFGFFVLFAFPSAENLSLSYFFAAFFVLILIITIFHFRFFRLRFIFDRLTWRSYLLMSWPLIFTIILEKLYLNIDSTIMGYFKQITEIGWYNAAQKIALIGTIPATLLSISFFPSLNRFFKESKAELQKSWNYYMESVIFFVIPFGVGGIILASKIIDFVYGVSYLSAILTFQVLIVGRMFIILAGPLGQILFVSNQLKKIFWVNFWGTFISLLLNLVLIPKYSLYGAAFAILANFILVFFLYFYYVLRFTPIKPVNLEVILNLVTSFFSVVPMYLVISYPPIYNLHVFWTILIGASIYSFFFLALRIFGKYVILNMNFFRNK